MVCFDLYHPLHKDLKLSLTSCPVGSEATIICYCDYFGRWGRFALCNTWRWCKYHLFFLKDQHEYKILIGLQWSYPSTHTPIKSSWNRKFSVFSANLTASTAKKVIGNLQKWTRIMFLLQRGCDNTAVKLVVPNGSPQSISWCHGYLQGSSMASCNRYLCLQNQIHSNWQGRERAWKLSTDASIYWCIFSLLWTS